MKRSDTAFLHGVDRAGLEFTPAARAEMQGAIEAVVNELGLSRARRAERDAIASRIVSTYRAGPRHPLNLVHAGLDAVGA